jgi:hypothetical protein
MRTKFRSGTPKGRDHLEDLVLDERVILSIMDLKEITWQSVD